VKVGLLAKVELLAKVVLSEGLHPQAGVIVALLKYCVPSLEQQNGASQQLEYTVPQLLHLLCCPRCLDNPICPDSEAVNPAAGVKECCGQSVLLKLRMN